MNRFPNYRFLPYWLVMPSIIVIVIFLIFPFAQAINLSFHRVSPLASCATWDGATTWRCSHHLSTCSA